MENRLQPPHWACVNPTDRVLCSLVKGILGPAVLQLSPHMPGLNSEAGAQLLLGMQLSYTSLVSLIS